MLQKSKLLLFTNIQEWPCTLIGMHFNRKSNINWYSVRNVLAKALKLIIIQIPIKTKSEPIPVRSCVRNANVM